MKLDDIAVWRCVIQQRKEREWIPKKKVVTDSPVCRRASRSKGIGFSLVGGEKCSRKAGTQDLVCPWRASAWAFRLQNSPWMKSVKVFLISNITVTSNAN